MNTPPSEAALLETPQSLPTASGQQPGRSSPGLPSPVSERFSKPFPQAWQSSGPVGSG